MTDDPTIDEQITQLEGSQAELTQVTQQAKQALAESVARSQRADQLVGEAAPGRERDAAEQVAAECRGQRTDAEARVAQLQLALRNGAEELAELRHRQELEQRSPKEARALVAQARQALEAATQREAAARAQYTDVRDALHASYTARQEAEANLRQAEREAQQVEARTGQEPGPSARELVQRIRAAVGGA